MKLHPSVVEKILYLSQTYGGFSNESKLKNHLQNLDFSVYERKTGNQEVILVLTEDLMKTIGKR